jgi:hypothetical protein
MVGKTSRLLMLNMGQAGAALNQEGHRSQRRVAVYRMAFIRSRSVPGGYESTSVWDTSPRGIGLLFHRQLNRGERLDVRFGQELARDCVAMVIHTLALRNGWWLSGCTLDPMLSVQEVRPLAE